MYCKECGSTVTSSDRFCPACGTPNALSKFHPKLAPGVKVHEARVITEVAPAGAPSCPRCHRLIESGQEYCVGCGMDLDAAWDRIQRVTVLNSWKQRHGNDLDPYINARWIILPLLLILVVGIILATVIGVTNLWLYARGEGFVRNGPANAELGRVLDVATLVALGLFAVGGLFTIAWTSRAYKNLPGLAVGDLRFSTSWAVLGWITPGFNFFRPKQIVDDVWRGSHPHAPPFSSSWRVGPVPIWSSLWWTTAWLGVALALCSYLTTPVATAAIDPAQRQSSLALAGTAGLLLAGSAACLHLLVRRITQRQEMRAEIVLSPEQPVEFVQHDPVIGLEKTKLLEPKATIDGTHGKY